MDFNNSEDRKWLIRILFALICGFLVGATIKKLLVYTTWTLAKTFAMPLSIIIALLIVLYLYDRSKNDDDNK